jgi:hypothetical protein
MAVTTSLGHNRVRATFNPSDDPTIDVIKDLTATLINHCENFKDKDPRLAALAQTAYEEACLWAVKAATA